MPECILWPGAVSDGYGVIIRDRHKTRAHRRAFQEFVGPIPAGHVVHHDCGVKLCVEPEHLRVLTIAEHMREHDNMARARETAKANQRAKTHCKRGHPYAEHGYVRKPGSRDAGSRQCMACQRERIAARRAVRPWLPLTPEAGYAIASDDAVAVGVEVDAQGAAQPALVARDDSEAQDDATP